ncbi:hypothetical protein ACTJI8_12740 [Microbacterium sp. 22303]|uniref:hypothetical protein n=1 Tax=Microbacterium sp. 22303 TaxID=3453905 RepID=UPI003F830319
MNRIWFPNQRWIRTALQVVLAAITLLGIIVAVAPQILDAIADVLPDDTVVWIAGAIATLAAISAAISRVMAIPAVDEFLKKFGAGSAPAGAVIHTDFDGSEIGLTRRQYRAMLDGADTYDPATSTDGAHLNPGD